MHANYSESLAHRITSRLLIDNPKAKVSGKYINSLICPQCDKPEGFTYTERPLAILCHRRNQCGATTKIRDVYPELFGNFEKHYPATKSDPNATARAYLESRGIDPSLVNDWYQGTWRESATGKTYQTVKFKIADGVYCHRIIDGGNDVRIRFEGKWSGFVYQNAVLTAGKIEGPVFIVEGIIDALSLAATGIPAVATLSSAALPSNFYKSNPGVDWHIAFDNDPAGWKAIDRHAEFFKQAEIGYSIALPPRCKDWNDLLIDGALNDDALDESVWRGQLYAAEKPSQYFEIHYRRKERSPHIFEFHGWTYCGTFDSKKEEFFVHRVTDCTLKILHSMIDDTVPYRQTIKHIVEIESRREGKNRLEFTAAELSSLTKFRESLSQSRQICDIQQQMMLNKLVERLYSDRPPKIRRLHALGYDPKSKCYVFSHYLYDQKGIFYPLGKDGYFERQGIMPFEDRQCIKHIETIDVNQFLRDLYAVFRWRGILALGFWITSAFSHDVFDTFGFFPFLSLYGAAHSGKSTLTRILNRCFFCDFEGLTMTKANTQKGELRRIAQKSSLVMPLLECTGAENTRFSLDTILGAYNRTPLATRAQTTNEGHGTIEVPITGTLAFVQNHEPFQTRPQKERVISIHFAEDSLDTESEEFKRLVGLSAESLAGVGDFVLRNRQFFESKLIEEINGIASSLLEKTGMIDRVSKNHAMALAGITLLLELTKEESLPVTEFAQYVVSLALTKCETAKTGSDLAEHFFQMVECIGPSEGAFKNEEGLFVNMPKAFKALKDKFGDTSDKVRLFAELKRHDRFLAASIQKKFIGGNDRYWHFRKVTL